MKNTMMMGMNNSLNINLTHDVFENLLTIDQILKGFHDT